MISYAFLVLTLLLLIINDRFWNCNAILPSYNSRKSKPFLVLNSETTAADEETTTTATAAAAAASESSSPASPAKKSKTTTAKKKASSEEQKQQQQEEQQQQEAEESSSTQEYIPITALDSYGSSPQIKNAMLASSNHGTTIVSGISICDGSVVICSIVRKRGRQRLGTFKSKSDVGVELLWNVEEETMDNHYNHENELSNDVDDDDDGIGGGMIGMVCSGLRSDANLLTDMMRSRCRADWERYDALPSTASIANVASDTMLTFLSYGRRSQEIHDGLFTPTTNGDDDDEEEEGSTFKMGRPFGIQALFFGTAKSSSNNSNSNNKFHVDDLFVVDPAGIVHQYHIVCIGKYSSFVNQYLHQNYNNKNGMDMSTHDIETLCIDALREVYREKEEEQEEEEEGIRNDDDEHDDDWMIHCEVIRGKNEIIQRDPLPLFPKQS